MVSWIAVITLLAGIDTGCGSSPSQHAANANFCLQLGVVKSDLAAAQSGSGGVSALSINFHAAQLAGLGPETSFAMNSKRFDIDFDAKGFASAEVAADVTILGTACQRAGLDSVRDQTLTPSTTTALQGETAASQAMLGECLAQEATTDGHPRYSSTPVPCASPTAAVKVVTVIPTSPGSPLCPGGTTGMELLLTRDPHVECAQPLHPGG